MLVAIKQDFALWSAGPPIQAIGGLKLSIQMKSRINWLAAVPRPACRVNWSAAVQPRFSGRIVLLLWPAVTRLTSRRVCSAIFRRTWKRFDKKAKLTESRDPLKMLVEMAQLAGWINRNKNKPKKSEPFVSPCLHQKFINHIEIFVHVHKTHWFTQLWILKFSPYHTDEVRHISNKQQKTDRSQT